MREHLQMGPFDSGIRLPFVLGLELNDGIVDTVHMHSAGNGLSGGAAFEGATMEQGAFKAARVCSRSAVAHQLAFCHSMEDALGIDIEPETASLRVLVAELERIAAHLEIIADVARCIEDVIMFSGVLKYIQKIRSSFIDASGNPYGMGLIVPGGVSMHSDRGEGMSVFRMSKVMAALVRDTGMWAGKLGFLGRRFTVAGLQGSSIPDGALSAPAFRASGLGADLRSGEDAYGFYESMAVDVETRKGGLALDRLLVLLGEIRSSVKLIQRAYRFEQPGFEGPGRLEKRSGKGVGFSEGPHGAIEYRLVIDSLAVVRKCRLNTAAADVVNLIPHALKGVPYENVATSLLSFSPCPFCLDR